MKEPKELELDFKTAAEPLPETDFARYLQSKFDHETARSVLKAFQQVGLPAPEKYEEFFMGKEGVLVFLNQYGIAIRIETIEKEEKYWLLRVNDSPWILQPVASIPAAKAIIEICPGCTVSKGHEPKSGEIGEEPEFLKSRLGEEGIDFWDTQIVNTGYLPIATPLFHKGIPVVIDRLAVAKLKEGVSVVKNLLSKAQKIAEAKEVTEATKRFYGPLQQLFSEAWTDAQKMQKFWSLCEKYVQDGKLIAGWNEKITDDLFIRKTEYAADTAKKYAARLQSAVNLQAVPQPPHHPM